jgi:hypothetical protein
MKKIILAFMISAALGTYVTCERNDLFDDKINEAFTLFNSGPAAPDRIYLYSYGVTPDGNLGGRSGADTLCNSIAPPSGAATVHAFLSVSATDQIRDLVPAAYWGVPVTDASGTNVISTTWALLWDESIDISLSTALVLGAGLEWWNGSNLDGTYNAASSCTATTEGFTSNLNALTGAVGNSNLSDNMWINWNNFTCNLNAGYLLCVAY